MGEYFEHAYEGFVNTTEEFAEVIKILIGTLKICLIYITVPIWIFPYWFFKKRKRQCKNIQKEE